MNIIIGEDVAVKLRQNYIVLELETFMVGGNPIKAFCVVNHVPLDELPQLEYNKSLHQKLMDEYNRDNKQYCQYAIDKLRGQFGGELDTFYTTILSKLSDKKDEIVTGLSHSGA